MPKILERLQDELETNYTNSDSYHVTLFNDARSSYSFSSANVSGNTITISGGHTFINGTRLVFWGTIPTPLSTGTIGSMGTTGIITITGTSYYAVNVSGNTFQVSTSIGGSVVTLTSTGSGTMTVSDVPLDATVPQNNVSEWVRKEVSSYEGASTRKSYPIGTVSIDAPNSRVKFTEQTIEFDNSSGSNSIVFTKAAIIRNGTSARGNTTGIIDSFFDFSAPQTIAPGENRAIKIPNILTNI